MKLLVLGALVSTALTFPGLAAAQQTNCITTGYGQQAHIWCNTTPAPQPDYQLQQSEAQFGSALGGAIREAIERHKAAKLQALTQERQLSQDAVLRGDCDGARKLAAKDKDMLAVVEGACARMPSLGDQARTEIRAFIADPSHRYFERERARMAELLNSGRVSSLEEAYALAVTTDPGLRVVDAADARSAPTAGDSAGSAQAPH